MLEIQQLSENALDQCWNAVKRHKKEENSEKLIGAITQIINQETDADGIEPNDLYIMRNVVFEFINLYLSSLPNDTASLASCTAQNGDSNDEDLSDGEEKNDDSIAAAMNQILDDIEGLDYFKKYAPLAFTYSTKNACHRVHIVDAVRGLTEAIENFSEEQLSFAIYCHTQIPYIAKCCDYSRIMEWIQYFETNPHDGMPISLAKENDNSRSEIFMTLSDFVNYSANIIHSQQERGVLLCTSIRQLYKICVELLDIGFPKEGILPLIDLSLRNYLNSDILINIKSKIELHDSNPETIRDMINCGSVNEIIQARKLRENNTEINELKERNFELSQQNILLEEKIARLEGLQQKQANTLNGSIGLPQKKDNTSNHSGIKLPKKNAVRFAQTPTPPPSVGLFSSAFRPINSCTSNNGHSTGEEKGKKLEYSVLDSELDTSTNSRKSGQQTPYQHGIN